MNKLVLPLFVVAFNCMIASVISASTGNGGIYDSPAAQAYWKKRFGASGSIKAARVAAAAAVSAAKDRALVFPTVAPTNAATVAAAGSSEVSSKDIKEKITIDSKEEEALGNEIDNSDKTHFRRKVSRPLFYSRPYFFAYRLLRRT